MNPLTFELSGKSDKWILNYLHKKYPKNYSKYAFTEASSSKYDSSNSIDFNISTYWICNLNKGPGKYLIIHVSCHMIQIKGYTIQSASWGKDNCNPKN